MFTRPPFPPPKNLRHRPSRLAAVGVGIGLAGWGALVGGCAESVPPATDEELIAQWEEIPPQCMGFDDPEAGTYRVYGSADPNPKEADPCSKDGGTAPGGHCNVPCGYVKLGDPIGNKNCECDAGFFVSCACKPLPSVAEEIPPYVGSCEDVPGSPTEYSQGNNDLFADHMHLMDCEDEFAACVTPDLPPHDENGQCAWTTPKGCLCLGGKWQCASTNSWFTCLGDDCPDAFLEAGAVNGNLKTSAHCQ